MTGANGRRAGQIALWRMMNQADCTWEEVLLLGCALFALRTRPEEFRVKVCG